MKNAFYAQSGGVTAVINASACGVIETARKHSDKIGTVYAGQNGIIGALTENLIDTSKESAADVAACCTKTHTFWWFWLMSLQNEIFRGKQSRIRKID